VDPHRFNTDPDPAFFLIADPGPDTDPDPVPNPGFDDQKLRKKSQLKKLIFFDKKLQFSFP
jgi:hypothetical protein